MKYLKVYNILESMKHLKLFESFDRAGLEKKANSIFIDWFLEDVAVDILKKYQIKKELVTAVDRSNKVPSGWLWYLKDKEHTFSRKGFIQRFKKDPKRDAIVWYRNGAYACIKPVQNLETYSVELMWFLEHYFTERIEGSEYRLSRDFMQLFSFHIVCEMRDRGVLMRPDGSQNSSISGHFYKEFKDKLIKIAYSFIKNL